MNILDQIIAKKRVEVAERKAVTPVHQLEQLPLFNRQPLSLKASLLDETKTGIIAEYKRRSPSKGVINDRNSVDAVTKAYTDFGASGVSVLTDEEFFGGSLPDLEVARKNDVPLLRKDFIVDDYQLVEAKAHGADVILLIAACLSPQQVASLSETAKRLGLEVLLELHGEAELGHICDRVDLVGVNNRNLKNFEVNLEQSVRLAEKIDNRFLKIAESGISSVSDVRYLKGHGFQGFLIGEYFMKQQAPAEAFRKFAEQL